MPLPTDDLALSQGCYFDDQQADRIIRFAETYVCPQFIKGSFTLLPWQTTWLRTLYGWRNKDGGKRFKRAALHVAKKNGKTFLVSIVCMFELFNPDIPSALVVSASTSRENATQVLKELANSIRRTPALDRLAKITPSTKRIRYEKNNAEYRALSADAGSAEGLNLSCCVLDECHAHRSDKLYRSLEYSTIARPDATLIAISTAGNDLTHWYYDLYSKAKRVLSGEDKDITFFPTIYELGEGDDPTAPTSWIKANPSIGISFSQDAFQGDLTAAKANTPDWHSFQRYRLNKWVSSSDETYLDLLKWDQAMSAPPNLKDCPCYLGVDLSQSVDPTSVSACWVLPDKRYFVKSWAWVAEEGCRRREAKNLPRFQQYPTVSITQGDMIDVERVKAHILDMARTNNVKAVVADQYSAFVLMNEIGQHGITVYRQPQSFRFMTEPMKEFSTAIMEKRILHDGNAWLRWCFSCLRTETDSYGNIRPHREKSCQFGGHIDGAVATFMAFGQAIRDNLPHIIRQSIYDERGITCV